MAAGAAVCSLYKIITRDMARGGHAASAGPRLGRVGRAGSPNHRGARGTICSLRTIGLYTWNWRKHRLETLQLGGNFE